MDEPYGKLNLFDLMILTFGIPIEIYLKTMLGSNEKVENAGCQKLTR